MRIFIGAKNCKGVFKRTIVTIGNFDGVHLGHQEILKLMNKERDQLGIETLLYTFEPHPIRVLFPEKDFFVLTPFEEKMELLKGCGIDNVVCETFTPEFSQTEPEDFIKDILCDIFKMKKLFIGSDFRFGYRARGDIFLMKDFSITHGFDVESVSPITINGRIVSSSLIRDLLREGRVREASDFLGRYFSIKTKIIKGSGIGKGLGIPTANCELRKDLHMRDGVYAVKVEVKGGLRMGVLSFGGKPTFGIDEKSMEVHIMDFNDDIYGEVIKIHFVERLRDIVSFSSVEELKREILRDIDKARSLLQNFS